MPTPDKVLCSIIYLFGVTIKHPLIFVVYNKRGYVDLVSLATEHSIRAAIEEVQTLPHHESNGEVRTRAKYTNAVCLLCWSIVGHH